MRIELRVPPLGESLGYATVSRWSKQVGDSVRKDEVLVELETDEITVEVAAPASGTLESVKKWEGETVGVNELLAVMEPGVLARLKPKVLTAWVLIRFFSPALLAGAYAYSVSADRGILSLIGGLIWGGYVWFALYFLLCFALACAAEMYGERFDVKKFNAGQWLITGALLAMMAVHLWGLDRKAQLVNQIEACVRNEGEDLAAQGFSPSEQVRACAEPDDSYNDEVYDP